MTPREDMSWAGLDAELFELSKQHLSHRHRRVGVRDLDTVLIA